MIDLAAKKDPSSFAYFTVRIVAVVIVAIICGSEAAGIVGGLI